MVSVVTSPEVDELNEPPAEIFDEVKDPLHKNGKTQNHLLLLNEKHFNPITTLIMPTTIINRIKIEQIR